MLPGYPADVEDWWLRRLQAHTGLREPRKSLPKIEPHIRALSDSFTRGRADAFATSYASADARLAYGVFFFPQNYTRTTLVLDELASVHRWTLPADGTRRILDLGAGLGAAALAAARHPALTHARIELTTVEAVPANQELQQRLMRDLLPHHVKFIPRTADFRAIEVWAPRRTHRWDLILLSFSLNEAFQTDSAETTAAWLNQAAAHLTEHGLLLVIEPALKETAENLEEVRDLLLARNQKLHVWAPCLHRAACPARARGAFWCHEARRWTPPPSLLFLNKTLHREIETLKFSFLALGRCPPPRTAAAPSPTSCRLVSPVGRAHGRLRFHGCAADGTVSEYDLLQRHLDSATKKLWWTTERGTILTGLPLRPLGSPHTYRIEPGPPPTG